MSAWIVSKNHIDQMVYGALRLGLIDPSQTTKVGRMLTNANKRSIRERYGRDDQSAAQVKTYTYTWPREPISDVSLLKQVNCYSYQTSEIWDYEKTTAYRFVQKMEKALRPLDRNSDGYDMAPWGV